MATTDTLTLPPPLSQSGSLFEFLQTLAYDNTSRGRLRMQADSQLLGYLEMAVRYSGTRQPDSALDGVSEDRLLQLAEEVATDWKGRWQLDGEDDDPVLDRLDRHFRPAQELSAERAKARAALLERRCEDERQRQEQYARAARAQRIHDLRAELAGLEGEQD